MTTEFAIQPAGIDPDVSASLQIYERIKPLKDALGVSDLTDAELQVFAIVARHTGLDPFSGQIRAVKRKGKVTHQTGIDGYRATAEKTRQYAGSSEAEFEECACGKPPANHPSVARVVVRRLLPNRHMVEQVGVARWHELYPEGDEGFMWRKMPFNQLSKCAEANGLRKAFPRVLGGVYIDEEMQQARETIEGESREAPEKPAPVTVADRIAARRAEREGTPAIVVDPTPQEAASEAPDAAQAADEGDDEPPAEAQAEAVDLPGEAASATCSLESPYGDGATCGLPAGHKSLHRQLGAGGVVVGSWPDR